MLGKLNKLGADLSEIQVISLQSSIQIRANFQLPPSGKHQHHTPMGIMQALIAF